jgi:thiamine biosynthesis protein ThiS
MLINGEKIQIQDEITIGELLASRGFDSSRVAVERNGEVVRRETFATQLLNDSDRVEIVQFVGGG